MPAGALVDLTAVKTQLNITSSTNDAELTGFLADAIEAIEEEVGPIIQVPITETFDRIGDLRIPLSKFPVVSVTSVNVAYWLGASPVDDTGAWDLNTDTGVLRRKVIGGSYPYLGPGSVVTVAYTAGRPTNGVPGVINRAILMQVADMWETQRGADALPAGGDDEQPPQYPGETGVLSPRVMELLHRHVAPPGIG